MSKQQFNHLADISFQRVAPSPALRPYIQWFWSIKSNGRLLAKRTEYMHPDGRLGLVFNWGDELEVSNGRYPQTATLDKIKPQSQQLTLTGHIEAFGILFRPGGAYPLFAIPMSALTSEENLHTFNLLQLHEQLYQAGTQLEKVAFVESWLKGHLANARPLANVINPSINLIKHTKGQLAIKQIASAHGVSPRQLERLYKEQVGLSPKKYARLIRMHHARATLKQGYPHILTEVAHLAGFYDQAHFNREFKATIGVTPGAYISRQEKRQL